VAVAVLLVGYGIVSAPAWRVLPVQQYLPSYRALLDSYLFLLRTGALVTGVLASLERLVLGYALGAVAGVAAGALMGWSRRADHVLDPLVQLVRFTPALAWLPLYMVWFGTGQVSMVLLIATGVAVVTLTTAYHAVRDIPLAYLRAARVLGARGPLLVRRVLLPAALPQLFDGLRVAIAVGWAIIVAAELVGARSGLGYLLVNAREYLNIPLVFVVLAHIGLLAFLMDLAGRRLHARATRWMRRRDPVDA
jgi:ABC-type nitrate/sulfonate/bicarbonate transport system permease component